MSYADSYDHYAVLQQEIADRMMERLLFFKQAPTAILEIACATGYLTQKLAHQYPDAAITAVDQDPAMMAHVVQKNMSNVNAMTHDIYDAAFRAGQFDLIMFNLFPDDHTEFQRLFERCYAWLKPEGYLMFSTFGVDTLKELRASFAAVDHHAHVNEYLDLHIIGDMLLKYGFDQPVMNAEWVTLTYHTLQGFWDDLKGVHSQLHDTRKRPGLLTPRALKVVEATYDTLREDDLYPATYEITYGMAQKPATSSMKAGVATITIDAIGGRKHG